MRNRLPSSPEVSPLHQLPDQLHFGWKWKERKEHFGTQGCPLCLWISWGAGGGQLRPSSGYLHHQLHTILPWGEGSHWQLHSHEACFQLAACCWGGNARKPCERLSLSQVFQWGSLVSPPDRRRGASTPSLLLHPPLSHEEVRGQDGHSAHRHCRTAAARLVLYYRKWLPGLGRASPSSWVQGIRPALLGNGLSLAHWAYFCRTGTLTSVKPVAELLCIHVPGGPRVPLDISFPLLVVAAPTGTFWGTRLSVSLGAASEAGLSPEGQMRVCESSTQQKLMENSASSLADTLLLPKVFTSK